MLHPSYSDLMAVANSEVEDGEQPVVQSRYSIVMATAKRAREIIDGSMPLVDTKPGQKPLSIAISEMNQGKITILAEEEAAKLAELEAKQAEENAEEDFLNIQEEDSEKDAEAVEESEDNEQKDYYTVCRVPEADTVWYLLFK